MQIEHKFTGGVFTKVIIMDAGDTFASHTHSYEHLSVVAKGKVEVNYGLTKAVFEAGSLLTVEACVPHSVTALEPSVWLCIHNEQHAQHTKGL